LGKTKGNATRHKKWGAQPALDPNEPVEFNAGVAMIGRKSPREGSMLQGVSVLIVGLAIMVAIWLVVLWGSRYLGPR
jgi:hypothetical protein